MKKPGFRWMSPEKMLSLMNVALGKEKADLVVSNGDVVNVYTGEVQHNYSVAVKGDRIAYVGNNADRTVGPETRLIDAKGKTVIPGLIDAHTHMLSINSPPEYIKHAMLHGATTIITEVQEVTFPVGLRAAKYFMNYLREQPIKFFFTVPPLVTISESAEHHFLTPRQVERMLQEDRVLGLGESYWLPTIKGEKRILDLLSQTLAAGKKLEGHSAGARNDKLVAYFASGITSCHESTTLEETLERMRLGASTMVREGGVRTELEEICKIHQYKIDFRNLALVTDGLSAQIFLEKGYMDHLTEKAIQYGISPVTAIQATTINPATHFSLDDVLGGIAPGKYADLVVIPDLKTIKPDIVVSNGKVVVENGRTVVEPAPGDWPDFITRSIRFPRKFKAEDFQIPAPIQEGKIKVRVIDQITELVTRELITEVGVSRGLVNVDTEQDIIKVAAISRVGRPGKIALGLLKGFGIKKGAFVSSGSWDCGGIILVGVDDNDMALAVNRLAELYGGAVVCCDGKIVSELPFPLGGVMSTLPMEQLNARQQDIQKAVEYLGSKLSRAHLSLDVLSTPAIPHLRISDSGIFNVRDNATVSLIVR